MHERERECVCEHVGPVFVCLCVCVCVCVCVREREREVNAWSTYLHLVILTQLQYLEYISRLVDFGIQLYSIVRPSEEC